MDESRPSISDVERWHALWRAFGASEAYDLELWDELQRCYAEFYRVYHTLDHIRDCLGQFDAARHLAARPAEVECALWFHDAVYDPRRPDNEASSARWAVEALRHVGAAAAVQQRVERLILATRHHAPASGGDAQLVADIDLSILGRSPAEFDRYEDQIRQEYAWLAQEAFSRARSALLQDLLARARIYQTHHFYTRYEAQARRNLARSLQRLDHAPNR
jgi:predicted metal-dependent HD superfamily phosphohydrolase